MFGIGFGEFVLLAVVLLIAVGPDKMPTFMKAVGKGVREFRRATRELRNSVGIDELMRDEDLQELRRPLSSSSRSPAQRTRPAYELTDDDLEAEFPADGTDLVHLRSHPPEGEPEAGDGAGDQAGHGAGQEPPGDGAPGAPPGTVARESGGDEPDDGPPTGGERT